jgi:hypothetical protein
MPRALRALCVLLMAAAASRAEAVDLSGTWYVLVHYKDDATAKPEVMHWEDRVWVFQQEGGDLVWKDYPIVVFHDDEGRFERSRRGYSRVVAPWEPSAGQLEQIRSGLEVNTRGAKTKTLAGSDTTGWHSKAKAQPQSAGYITYSESWSVEDPGGKPVFGRQDVLGASSMEALEGGMRFTTQSVSENGGELRGTYERDGTRHGTFRMMRAGPVGNVGQDGKTPNEKQRERMEALIREALKDEGGLVPDAPGAEQ